MSGNKRAFARRLNDISANSSISSVQSQEIAPSGEPKQLSSAPTNFFTGKLEDQVVEPVDFEKYVKKCPDPVAEFPTDDIEIQTQSVAHTTDISSNPINITDHHVAECVQVYRKPKCSFHRKYSHLSPQFSAGARYLVDRVSTKLVSLDYSSDNDTNTWNSAPFRERHNRDALLDIISTDTHTFQAGLDKLRRDRKKEPQRTDELLNLFVLETSNFELNRLPRENYNERFANIIIRCINANVGLNLEPVFFSMFLYDLTARKRISESFYFDMNSNIARDLLKNHNKVIDDSSLIRDAIFSVSNFSDDIYLVVRIEKVLQSGDIDSVCEPYFKVDRSSKSIDKMKVTSAFWCDIMGAYRMPFAWTAINIIDIVKENQNSLPVNRKVSIESATDNSRYGTLRSGSGSLSGSESSTSSFLEMGKDSFRGSFNKKRALFSDELFSIHLLKNFSVVDINLKSFFMQNTDKLSDEDIADLITGLKANTGAARNLKALEFSVDFQMGPVSAPLPNRYTPDLVRVNDEEPVTTKMVLEFPTSPIMRPFSSYINLLYIYPKHLNMAKIGFPRSVCLKISLFDGKTLIPNVFGKSSDSQYRDHAVCAISYHNKSPSFYEEVKVRLPMSLPDTCHLLFEFYHVSCHVKKDKKGTTEGESFIGATWLPVYDQKYFLVSGDKNLPVAAEKLDQDYYLSDPVKYSQQIKWIDSRKEIFSVSVIPHSSVHAPDNRIQYFFFQYSKLFNSSLDATEASLLERKLKKSTMELPHAKSEVLVHFMPVIFDKLLRLLVTKTMLADVPLVIGRTAFDALINIVDRIHMVDPCVDGFDRSQILLNWVQKDVNFADFLRNTESADGGKPKKVHIELMTHFMDLAGADKDTAMCRSWFLMELIIKSLAQENETGGIGLRLAELGESRLQPDIWAVVLSITQYVTRKNYTDQKFAAFVNLYLSFFLSDLFSVCNRYWALLFVKLYLQHMNNHVSFADDVTAAIALKYDFLRVICTHEHFVMLNLPFCNVEKTEMSEIFDLSALRVSMVSITSQGSIASLRTDIFIADKLSVEFREVHFLVGILLFEVATVLRSESHLVEKQVLTLLMQVSQFVDRDPRYSKESVKSRVMVLFFPLLELFAACKDILAPSADAKKEEILESANSMIAGFKTSTKAPHRLTPELTRQILALFLWICKNSASEAISKWMSSLAESMVLKLADITRKAANVFEYRGVESVNTEVVKNEDVKQKIEGLFFGNQGARNELMMRRKIGGLSASSSRTSLISTSGNSTLRSRWHKDDLDKLGLNSMDSLDMDVRLKFETNVCFECTFVCIDMINYLIDVTYKNSHSDSIIRECVACLNDILSRNQPSAVIVHSILLQREIISQYANFILLEDSDLCSQLCLRLLETCCSSKPEVRMQAASSLYLVLRLGFCLSENQTLSRFKIQLIISLSSLVPSLDQAKTNNLERAFKSIVSQSFDDMELKDTSFANQVKDMGLNLHAILLDTLEMEKQGNDSEMQLDLMYRVANGYRSSLDLRLTWLKNMQTFHVEKSQFAEAGMCVLHSAAVVTEGLYYLDGHTDNPIGATAFEDISINVLEESLLDFNPDDYYLSSNTISRATLTYYLEKAAELFKKAGLFELSANCYQHLINMHKNSTKLSVLCKFHKKICGFYQEVAQLEVTGKRWFPQYFRVGFYGPKLDALDRCEFIYKEKPYTQLSVISSRLEQSFAQKFGPKCVELLKNSDVVDTSTLSADKVYIQVTFVEPWLDFYQNQDRKTLFERNVNLNQFMFNVPFTKSGKAHATELNEQWKTRVILSTQETFPYMKTRLPVISRTEQILSPIEVATEDLSRKMEQFQKTLDMESGIDAKRLQLILQGCIGTQVNQGPTEIALVFLDNISQGGWTVHHDKLRLLFKGFMRLCRRGLALNKSIIKEDQLEYQAQLERDFEKMKATVEPLLINPLVEIVSPDTPTNTTPPIQCPS